MRILLLLCLSLLPAAAFPAVRHAHLRLATWNVNSLYDDLDDPWDDPVLQPWEVQEKLNRICHVLRPLKPQVLALQEVEKRVLLERLGLELGHCAVVAREGPHGFGILSQLPVLGYRSLAGGRCLEVHLQGSFPMVLLACSLDRDDRQRDEAWRVATRVWELKTQEPRALVAVLGDLEAPWGHSTLVPLRQVGLLDPCQDLPFEQRYTCDREDHLWVTDHILVNRALAARVVPEGMGAFRHRSVELASDHWPVYVDVR